MSILLCGTLDVTIMYLHVRNLLHILMSQWRENARMVLVVWREGYTRSHSELGSQAS